MTSQLKIWWASPLLRASALALGVLWLLCALVSYTGGLPEPLGTLIGQNLSRTGHVLFLTLGIAWILFSPLAPGETRLIRFATLLFALFFYLVCVEGFKHFVYLPRPGQSSLRSEASRGSGFPSGHTVPAFEVAYLLALISPRLTLPALAMAVFIGYSRVEVTAHYAYQVVLSAALGLLGGSLIGQWRAASLSHRQRKALAPTSPS